MYKKHCRRFYRNRWNIEMAAPRFPFGPFICTRPCFLHTVWYFKFPISILDSFCSVRWLRKSNIHNITRATFDPYLPIGFIERISSEDYCINEKRNPSGDKLQEMVVSSHPQCRTVSRREYKSRVFHGCPVMFAWVNFPRRPPSSDRERNAPRSRPFFRRVKFLRLDGATLTDAPAEEIVPRDAPERARAIVCMKNRRDAP